MIVYIATGEVEFLGSSINRHKSLLMHCVIVLIIFVGILKMFALCEEFAQNINL